ncbi:MAG: bifunctional 4-hydroxy-2-oxoglutarate aldolase/2-dehydro-3-deoxy-phosphogluconate aldolase [Spirochaetaceae bacterium]|jgi:2-dehydro-3-deoxyphosphogluconate aldolase/(4S)-4-hydroxy-2-oxoglutarate aldolase|nr:bifunctional 4-hydroxy-2-oxoglutarate aldolase/2-dehydro-3-deoxy-phosphogluconate aldolase [Spirochaetaceae bacterium]
MSVIFEKLERLGLVPVIKIDDPDKAVPLAKALQDGSLPCAEITFRTKAGEESIKRITQALPDILVGAGTVLTQAQVDAALAAGAQFIVSPGFNPKVVAYCLEKKVPVIPGCANPSDIEAAIEHGLSVVKFFPAEQAGGLPYIKALAGPYSGIKFVPTGGIGANNVASYISYNRILACGGSWMVPPDALNAGDFDKITRLCREALFSMLNFSVTHFAINSAHEKEAAATASFFASVFSLPFRETSVSFFASDAIEVMKSPGLGAHGHIAIATTSAKRAIAYLERQGLTINESTIRKDANGEPTFAYLSDEIAGFAVHIIQKK